MDRWYHSRTDDLGRLIAEFRTARSDTVPMDKVTELDRIVREKFPSAELTKVCKSIFGPMPEYENWKVVWSKDLPKA